MSDLFKGCEKCSGGYIRIDDGKRAVECVCLRRKKLEASLREANVYESFWSHLRLDIPTPVKSPEQGAMRRMTAEFVNNLKHNVTSGNGLFLTGEAKGTGKTTHLLIILKAAIEAGYPAHNAAWPDLIRWMISDKEEIDRMRDVRMLMIDEIGNDGIRAESEFPQTTFDYVLRHRMARGLPTLMGSNLSPLEFDSRYPGIKSLLSKRIPVFYVKGVDWRQL